MLESLKAALLAIQSKALKPNAAPIADAVHYLDPAEFNTLLEAAKANNTDAEAALADTASLKASRTADEAVQANMQTTVNGNTTEINSLKASRTQDEAAIAALPGFYPVGLGVDPNTLNIPSGYVFADDGTNLWIRRPGETNWSTRNGSSAPAGTLAFTAQPQLKANSVTASGWSVRFLYQDAGTAVTVEQQLANGGPWVAVAPSWINGAWQVDVTGQPAGAYQHKIRLTEGASTVVSNSVTVDISLPTSTVSATSVTSSQATFAGTPTLPTQGQVQKYRVAYQLIGTDASADVAVAAGRYLDVTTVGDISAFAGAGVTKTLALAGGSQYTFSVQTTALCGDGVATVTGGWVAGNTVTVDALPTASGVSMDIGPYAVGANIPGHYTYGDLDGQPENGTTFKHYRGTKADGSDKLVISGATTLDYVAQSADAGLYVFLGVTPKDASGTGVEVISAPVAVAPQALTGLSVSPGIGQNIISWNAGLAGATYNLYRRTVAGVTKLNGTKIVGVTSPYTDPSLANGQTYYYVVTQVGVNGVESVESTEQSGTPQYITNLSTAVSPINDNTSVDNLVVRKSNASAVCSVTGNGKITFNTTGLSADVACFALGKYAQPATWSIEVDAVSCSGADQAIAIVESGYAPGAMGNAEYLGAVLFAIGFQADGVSLAKYDGSWKGLWSSSTNNWGTVGTERIATIGSVSAIDRRIVISKDATQFTVTVKKVSDGSTLFTHSFLCSEWTTRNASTTNKLMLGDVSTGLGGTAGNNYTYSRISGLATS